MDIKRKIGSKEDSVCLLYVGAMAWKTELAITKNVDMGYVFLFQKNCLTYDICVLLFSLEIQTLDLFFLLSFSTSFLPSSSTISTS